MCSGAGTACKHPEDGRAAWNEHEVKSQTVASHAKAQERRKTAQYVQVLTLLHDKYTSVNTCCGT